jgi:hypothetical protein
MIFYQDMNDGIHIYPDGYFDNQPNHDALLQIAVDIVLNGYQGLVLQAEPLESGEYFVGINFREDTPEGKIFSQIQADFERGLSIPTSRKVLKKIRKSYRRREEGKATAQPSPAWVIEDENGLDS